MDQAQHFGGSAEATAGSGGGEEFREGLDATERDCTFSALLFLQNDLIKVDSICACTGKHEENKGVVRK